MSFIKKIGNWEVHHNKQNYWADCGDFFMMTYDDIVWFAERHFLDPLEPTDSEWTLFTLEYGEGESCDQE